MAGSTRPYAVLDRALKEVRVLDVHPGEGTDIVIGTLRTISMAERPPPSYETVSYVWGDPGERADVLLDGVLIDVPVSSTQVLRRMRLPRSIRTIWIDAICIDQSNIAERSQQVAMMGDIYRNTAGNLIWLGEATGSTRNGFGSATILVTEMTERFGPPAMWGHLLNEGIRWAFEDPEPFPEQVHLQDLLSIYKKPWFTRLWIWQEAILPEQSTCHCGPNELDLRTILAAAACLSFRRKHIPGRSGRVAGLSAANNIFAFAYTLSKGHAIDLLQTFLICQRTQCSDHRDRIFGMLGLFDVQSLAAPSLFAVDYAKSLAAVLRDSIRAIILQHGHLNMLNYVMPRHTDPELDGLPSWVPVFSESTNLDIHWFELDWVYGASGKKGSIVKPAVDDGILALDGILIDSVTRMSENLEENKLKQAEDRAKLLEACHFLISDAAKSQNASGPIRVDGIIASTLTGHQTGQDSDGSESLLTKYHTFSRFTKARPADENPTREELEVIDGFGSDIAVRCHNRRVYATKEGYFGLGTWTMQSGDVLAVLFGAMWPVLLRPLLDGTFTVVGVTYVSDLMNGEAVAKLERGGGQVTTFALR